jgi:hypothetical protein
MTIYEDAFLSLTDYQSSPAEILFFPRGEEADDHGRRIRDAEVWMRGDYEAPCTILINALRLSWWAEIWLGEF